MKKGFVITFSTMFVAIVILFFALFYFGRVQREESIISSFFPVEKSGYVADDIDADINYLLMAEVDVNNGSQITYIRINDMMQQDINKLQLLDYNSFVNDVYSGQQNASVLLGLDKLVDGKTELLFSNGLQYDYNYSQESSIMFYAPAADTNVIVYDINITVNSASVLAVPWNWQDSTGDINVNLNFIDQNAANEVHKNGKLNSASLNIYRWDYGGSGSSFYIKVGSIAGNAKALQLVNSIDSSFAKVSVGIGAKTAPLQSSLKWNYDADLNYAQGNTKIGRKIGMGRG